MVRGNSFFSSISVTYDSVSLCYFTKAPIRLGCPKALFKGAIWGCYFPLLKPDKSPNRDLTHLTPLLVTYFCHLNGEHERPKFYTQYKRRDNVFVFIFLCLVLFFFKYWHHFLKHPWNICNISMPVNPQHLLFHHVSTTLFTAARLNRIKADLENEWKKLHTCCSSLIFN